MKTIEELSRLREEVKALNKKLAELSEDELELVTGGYVGGVCGEIMRSTQRTGRNSLCLLPSQTA